MHDMEVGLVNALLAANLTGTLAILFATWRHHQTLVERIDWTTHRQTKRLKGVITVSAQDTLNAVVAKLNKAREEIVAARDALSARIGELQDQIDSGTPAEELDLSELTAAAQALDDIVPDEVPVEIPAEEPPAEVPDEESVPADDTVADA